MGKIKITAWAMSSAVNGEPHLVLVRAMTRRSAVATLGRIGYVIADAEHVKRACLVPYPGPSVIAEWQEYHFENEMSIAEYDAPRKVDD